MLILLRIAARNLLRNTRRTFLTTLSISVGLGVILWFQSVLAGRNKVMVERVTSSRTGHLQIHREDYLKDKSVQSTFETPEVLAKLLPSESAVAKRVFLPALISSGEQSSTLVLVGIEPKRESQVTTIAQTLKEGSFLEEETAANCPSRQIYIGKALAEFLKVDLGNKLVIMAQAVDGTLGNDLFRVKGIFTGVSTEVEKSFAYAPIPCVHKIGAFQGVHELVVRLPDGQAAESLQHQISQELPQELKVSTWKEAMPSLASVIRLNDAMLLMISMILFVVITLGIINVLLIGIFERIREFGVMIALGTTPLQLKLVVLYESLILGIASSVLGTLLGLSIVLYQSKMGLDLTSFIGERTTIDQFKLDFLIYPVFQFTPYCKAVLMTIFFVLVAGVYPAFRASRLNPVEAIRST